MVTKLSEWVFGGAAEGDAMRRLISQAPFELPNFYLDFLRIHDGSEGYVDDELVIIWAAGDVINLNVNYEREKYIPEFFLIGSNGIGDAFAFGRNSVLDRIAYIIPFIGMSNRYASPTEFSFESILKELI